MQQDTYEKSLTFAMMAGRPPRARGFPLAEAVCQAAGEENGQPCSEAGCQAVPGGHKEQGMNSSGTARSP